jgi:thiol-disulfide isomerase/thioredoxin
MSPEAALLAVVAIVAVATLIGVLVHKRAPRIRAAEGAALDPASLRLEGAEFGSSATLVQFSTEFCARCPQVRRQLSELASRRAGVVHLEVDLTQQPDLARRFNVLQTPTVLFLDADGVPRARISGAPSLAAVSHELDQLEGAQHV